MIADEDIERWNFHPGWDDEMKKALRDLLEETRPANNQNDEAES